MYTIKFIRFYETGYETIDAVHCPHYEASKTPHGWVIITYPTHKNVDGVERVVLADRNAHSGPVHDRGFDTCYVESISGDTVAVYRG